MSIFTRHFRKRKEVKQMVGYISSSSNCGVVIKLDKDLSAYKPGQRISVSIQRERKAASGEILKVPEVVAHGKITDISDGSVTIQSSPDNPIISKHALSDNRGKKSLMLVREID